MLCFRTCTLLLCLSSVVALAQPPRNNPESPFAVGLQSYGQMIGTITKSVKVGWGESYGRRIIPLGSVNNDTLADWAVERLRCDTSFGGKTPEEVLVYRGVRGGLPSVDSGQRIGPSELSSRTHLLCAGDWDDDGNRDLAVAIEIMYDTTGGDPGYQKSRLVVFWGNASGNFTIEDTSHLMCNGQMWLGIIEGLGVDFSGDGIDDLLIRSGFAMTSNQVIRQPFYRIYTGTHFQRWGRSNIPRNAEWKWWSPRVPNRIAAIDQDCDGNFDVAIHYDDESVTPGRLAVLYGRAGLLPDTTDLEEIDLAGANGHYTLFSDVTGDHTLDLVMTCGRDEMLKVFAGRPSQRLTEMFGSGNDAPSAGKGWWRRPWADIWLPYRLHDGWTRVPEMLYDLGDISGDGISEIWAFSRPYLIAYSGGNYLDSIIDATIRIPFSVITGSASLGDIDGSGRQTIAIGYDQIPHSTPNAFPGGVFFMKPGQDVSIYGVERALPHLAGESCGGVASVVRPRHLLDPTDLRAEPNPVRGDLQLRWDAERLSGEATVVVSDAIGRERLRLRCPVTRGVLSVPTGELSTGAYFATFITAATATTLAFAVQ